MASRATPVMMTRCRVMASLLFRRALVRAPQSSTTRRVDAGYDGTVSRQNSGQCAVLSGDAIGGWRVGWKNRKAADHSGLGNLQSVGGRSEPSDRVRGNAARAMSVSRPRPCAASSS